MKGLRYVLIFVAAMLLPAFMITANILKKEGPGRGFTVTELSGMGSVQYTHQDLDVFSPILNGIVTRITETEMRTFVKEVKHVARRRRHLPAALKETQLEEGDHEDPWNTVYYYEKLGPRKAVLISAGPDRELHTKDDIIAPIEW
ncbi:MAG: hypothetical protein JW821_17190 [Deltaproteobacteria bacterium]|nr:hypothetical protein [Deltaproteobacteria bacterium]